MSDEQKPFYDDDSYKYDSYKIKFREYSEWQCHLFGSNGDGITWRPLKGQEPNWFWRKMNYLILGNKWVKDE